MKKRIAILLVLVTMLSLSACNGASKSKAVKASVTTNSGETKEMTFEEIKNIAKTNSILFEDEYVGASISVTSTITAIGGSYLYPSWFDCDAYIELDASDFLGCWFYHTTEEYAASVNVGDCDTTITVFSVMRSLRNEMRTACVMTLCL